MKSYSDLFHKLFDEKGIISAIKKSAKTKKKKSKRILRMLKHPEKYIEYYKKYIIMYYSKEHNEKIIYDANSKKYRKILPPTFDEQVMQNIIIGVLGPIIAKELHPHVHGSIPGTGITKNVKQIKKWIKKDPKGTKYYFKCDIKHFFDMINHSLLKSFLDIKIRDKRFYRLLCMIINCTKKGVPLGFPLSHWLAHWYIASIDHEIINKFRPAHYTRYVDDIVVFDSSKSKLYKIKRHLRNALMYKMLVMKDNYQVNKLDSDPLDFMGYRFYPNKTIFRKSLMIRMSRRAKRVGSKQITIHNARRMVTAIGYLKIANCHNFYLNYIKPEINFGDCRKYISIYDRRLNQCGKNVLAA